ncbi:MAG: hypothetical protein AAGD12_01945 [Pseudomonadota bacterium]
MDSVPRIALRHLQGAWLAENATERGRAALGGFSRLPVMRDFGDDGWRWDAPRGYESRPACSNTADMPGSLSWWMRPEHKEWRALLLSGAPVWIRRAGTAAPESLGVYEIDDVVLDASEFSFRLGRKLADAEGETQNPGRGALPDPPNRMPDMPPGAGPSDA